MKDLYQMIGITKQGHYKRVAAAIKQLEIESDILDKATQIRKDHKRLGCRKLYNEIKPVDYGRDKTESLLLSSGFRVPRKRSYTRTTYSGVHRFKNLVSGSVITDINQLWVSDITYLPVGHKKSLYLTLIQDVYSRVIVGWSLSSTMRADDTVVRAYKQAIKDRKQQLDQLIFHSDRGSQYGSEIVQSLHSKYNIRPSMGNKAWENAHAESLNGILKNEYITLPTDVGLNKAVQQVGKWIKLYNCSRPHGSLNNSKPEEFETFLLGLAPKERPIVKINY